MLDAYTARVDQGDLVEAVITLQGNTSSNPTKVYGAGCTLTRTAEGKLRFTWSDYQGVFAGATYMLGDTAPSNIAGYTAFFDKDSYTASTKALDVWIYTAADALGDLPTTAYLTVKVLFKRASV